MDLERKIKRNYNKAMFKIHKNVREAEEKGIKDKVERNKIRDENQEIYDSAVKAYNRDTKLLGVQARRGKTVAKKTTAKKSGAKPSNPALYARVKAEAKRKFKVYPSAYANAWLVRTYKKRGGRYS